MLVLDLDVDGITQNALSCPDLLLDIVALGSPVLWCGVLPSLSLLNRVDRPPVCLSVFWMFGRFHLVALCGHLLSFFQVNALR